jgi:3-oxoacyl-[acyl-carrier protein] reductase
MQTIRGRKALVTGAASGLGRAIALALAREGADLYLVDQDEAKLHATAREAQVLGVRVLTRLCDLTRPAEISACVRSVLTAWGALGILVNNAGIAHHGPTHDMTVQQWDRLMAVNLFAPIQFVRELLPVLAAEDEAHILNVCSIFALVPLAKGAAYQVSKSGLVGLSAALRAEYGRHIGVTALCPLLDTFSAPAAGQERHFIPAWMCASRERVATAAVDAIRRNKGVVVVGRAGRLLWGMQRFSPRLVEWITRGR